jgi:hypothetical protein
MLEREREREREREKEGYRGIPCSMGKTIREKNEVAQNI